VNQKRTSGFTLIEMVISLTLLSFITVIGYQGLMFSVKQWQQGDDKMALHYDYYQTISWIRNKIGAAVIVQTPGGNDYNYFFTGNRGSVEFVARYNRTRRGGLYVNKIIFDKDDNSIQVSYYLHHPDIKNESKATLSERITLLSNVKSIRFSYYGRKTGRTALWHNDWKNANSLPRLVKVDIENEAGEHFESTIHIATSNNA